MGVKGLKTSSATFNSEESPKIKFCSDEYVLEQSVIFRIGGFESLQLLCRDKSGCVLQEQVEKFSIPISRKDWMSILYILPVVRINGVPFSLVLSGRRVANPVLVYF